MKIEINEYFIAKWHPCYDEDKIAGDEDDYEKLCRDVASELNECRSLSRQTFKAIWAWKGATRVIRFIQFDKYELLYAEAFRRAIEAPVESKLGELISDGKKLPGVGAPTGSTILHFMFPDIMPIIDVRTVEVLHEAGLVKWKDRSLENYNKFRETMELVKKKCGRFTLRQIDRALFTYHKAQVTRRSGSTTVPCDHD